VIRLNENENKMEEKEYNDIESLAAFLHSGKMQEEKSAGERLEMGLSPEPEETRGGSELESVLFSIEGRNRQTSHSLPKEDEPDFTTSPQRRKTATPADPSIPANPLMKAGQSSSLNTRPERRPAQHSGSRKKNSGSFAENMKKKFGSVVSGAKNKIDDLKTKKKDEENAVPERPVRRERTEFPAKPEPRKAPPAALSDIVSAPKSEKTAVHAAPEIRTEKPSAAAAPVAVAEKPAAPAAPVSVPETTAAAASVVSAVPAEKAVKSDRHTRSPRHEKPDIAEKKPADEIPALAASLSAALGEKAAEIVEQRRNELPADDIPEVFDIEEGSAEEEEFDNTATRLMNAVNDPQARSVSMKEEADEEEEEARAERIMAARLRLNYERQKQGTRTLAYILIALLLCAAILGASAYASTYIVKWALDFTGVASQEFQLDVTIPDDADLDTVSAILAENNIISDAKFFKFYADFADKLKKEDEKKEFIGGKYTVSSTMSYSTLLSILRTKVTQQKTVSVRIVEGMTAHDIAVLLEENNVCFAEDFEKYYKNIQNNYDFERRVKEETRKFNQLEGYLFPDTYEFYIVNEMENGGRAESGQTSEEAYDKMKKASEENALEAAKKMYSNFNSKITRSMYKKMGEMHLTLDETIALASMVQKEAASEEDMGNVASVFLNRIRNSAEYPYLQSDVTVLYVENDIKPYITGTDTAKQRIYDSYNTYTCKGIPAGAVCNPGLSAINAVLYAPETPYYYFCANEDTGEIYYAETKEEHEENLVLAGLTAGEQVSPEPYGEGSDSE
jgi:UPF0755 protein